MIYINSLFSRNLLPIKAVNTSASFALSSTHRWYLSCNLWTTLITDVENVAVSSLIAIKRCYISSVLYTWPEQALKIYLLNWKLHFQTYNWSLEWLHEVKRLIWFFYICILSASPKTSYFQFLSVSCGLRSPYRLFDDI